MEEVKQFIISKLKKELNNFLEKEKIEQILNILGTKPLDIWREENNDLIDPFTSVITENGQRKNIIKNCREIVKAYYQIKPIFTEQRDPKLLSLISNVQQLAPYVKLKLEQSIPNINEKCDKEFLENTLTSLQNNEVSPNLLKQLKDMDLIDEEEYRNNISIINSVNNNPKIVIEESQKTSNVSENSGNDFENPGIIKIIMPENITSSRAK